MDEVRVYSREVDYSLLNQIGGIMNENCCGMNSVEEKEFKRTEAPRDEVRNTRSLTGALTAPILQAPAAKEIVIRTLNHGYVVVVGCQSFAIEDAIKLSGLILTYLRNPAEVEKAWMTNNKDSKFYPNFTEGK